MRRTLTDAGPETEFWQQLREYQVSAWRFEQQKQYDIGYEQLQLQAFLTGRPESPLENVELGAWMRQVASQTAAGKSIGRVRIVDTPITDYQRWMAWMDQWNREAGEQIDYLPRKALSQIPPAPFGDTDWWLFDEGTPEARVMIMHFDAKGFRRLVELESDPAAVGAAVDFRRCAIQLAQEAGVHRHRSGGAEAA